MIVDMSELIRLLTMAYNEGKDNLDPFNWRAAMETIRYGDQFTAPNYVGDDDSLIDLVSNAISFAKRPK